MAITDSTPILESLAQWLAHEDPTIGVNLSGDDAIHISVYGADVWQGYLMSAATAMEVFRRMRELKAERVEAA